MRAGCGVCGAEPTELCAPDCARTESRDYHMSGTAYCNCDLGTDHEGDAEADAAWDRYGPMGLAELGAKRQQAEIERLQAERDKALAVLRDLVACWERAMPQHMAGEWPAWGRARAVLAEAKRASHE